MKDYNCRCRIVFVKQCFEMFTDVQFMFFVEGSYHKVMGTRAAHCYRTGKAYSEGLTLTN